MGDLDYGLASFIAKMNMEDVMFNFYNKSKLWICMSTILVATIVLVTSYMMAFIRDDEKYLILCTIVNIPLYITVIIHQVIIEKFYEKYKEKLNEVEAYIDYLNGKELPNEIQERTKIIQEK